MVVGCLRMEVPHRMTGPDLGKMCVLTGVWKLALDWEELAMVWIFLLLEKIGGMGRWS